MEGKKISTLHKWFLKYTNRPAYNAYKLDRRKATEIEQEKIHLQMLEEKFITFSNQLEHPQPPSSNSSTAGFKHSGNSGDIIYSLPAVFALSQGKTIELFLHADRPIDNRTLYHPLGNVMLNDKMIAMLKPLLLHQPQIKTVERFSGQAVDYDLDLFRSYTIPLDRGSIVRWYFLVYGVSYDTSKPWLIAPKNENYKDSLVIARSHRYRSPVVDYSFLKKYPHKIFLGLEEEFLDMKKVLPDIEHKPVNDFLEMATIVNSCKLFIGNQSFPFSLAEALKVKRLLEVHYLAPNVVVEGEGANDFMYQPQFEYSVKRLLEA